MFIIFFSTTNKHRLFMLFAKYQVRSGIHEIRKKSIQQKYFMKGKYFERMQWFRSSMDKACLCVKVKHHSCLNIILKCCSSKWTTPFKQQEIHVRMSKGCCTPYYHFKEFCTRIQTIPF